MARVRSPYLPLRDLLIVLALTVAGQLLIQMSGAFAPALVRYPGPWEPTVGADTLWYLRLAADLPAFEQASVTKLGYLGLLWIDTRLSLGGWGVVGVQSTLLLIAGLSLFRVVGARFGPRAGMLAAGVLLLNPQVTQWTKVLLIEGVFIPSMVILVVLLARAEVVRSLRPIALAFAAASVLIRPNGVGAVLGTVGALAMQRDRGRRVVPFLLGTIAVVLIVVLTPVFATPGGDEDTIAARTYGGLVIWVAPDHVTIPMPPPGDASDLSNVAAVRYAAEHPIAVARLAAQRVFWELVQVRPHYPTIVNVVLGLQMGFVFALALIGARRMRDDALTRSTRWVSVGLLLVVAGTWAVAEGRFGWAMLATWSPWIGVGADSLLERRLTRAGPRPTGTVEDPG